MDRVFLRHPQEIDAWPSLGHEQKNLLSATLAEPFADALGTVRQDRQQNLVRHEGHGISFLGVVLREKPGDNLFVGQRDVVE